MIRADIITVFHNDTNFNQHEDLLRNLEKHERGFRFVAVDNRVRNRGFAAGCNLGAFHPQAKAPIIGFLNPDVRVQGPFLDVVEKTLVDNVVITGCRFGKPARELAFWGVRDWVCGATMFVKRAWFVGSGGFDEQFVWSHEETDLIRRAQRDGLVCRSTALPLEHSSPNQDSPEDAAYKRRHFAQAQKRYLRKWGTA